MTVYEQELRKLFEHSNLVDRPQFSGRVCVGDLGKDLRVRAEFLSTHISSQYDAIRLTVLNRTEGVVDRDVLRFQDVWGKSKWPNNPNFRSGVIPHLWVTTEKWNGTPIIPLPRTMPLCGMPSVSICPHSGSARRSWNGAAPSWSISVLRCGAM